MIDQDERRGAVRHRTLKPASIRFNRGASTIDCMIRDLSGIGAALEISTPVGVPDEFDLAVPGEDVIRHCRVTRRSPSRLGVMFVR